MYCAAAIARTVQSMPDLSLLQSLCRIAGETGYFASLHPQPAYRSIAAAVRSHDTPALFDWLMEILSYQGVSDAIAWTYMNQHGRVAFSDLAQALRTQPSCPRLASYWHFHDCRFAKSAGTCAEPAHISACPLPTHDLRNGRLNQTAYALFLFLRDICDGDLVGWIDGQLQAVPDPSSPDYPERLGQAVIGPMRHVFGVSHKVLNMTFADLLIGADPNRSFWKQAGQHMVAIDTLIHNLLHRTGTLAQCEAEHAYGPACYAPQGCASIVRALASEIDARAFDPIFPATFPRFVQHALWAFCAQDELNVCNGNQIDDSQACEKVSCLVFESCARVPL